MRKKLTKIFVVYIVFILLFSCTFETMYSFAESEPVTNETNENIVTEGENTTEESNNEPNYEEQIEGLENQKSDLENQITSNDQQK